MPGGHKNKRSTIHSTVHLGEHPKPDYPEQKKSASLDRNQPHSQVLTIDDVEHLETWVGEVWQLLASSSALKGKDVKKENKKEKKTDNPKRRNLKKELYRDYQKCNWNSIYSSLRSSLQHQGSGSKPQHYEGALAQNRGHPSTSEPRTTLSTREKVTEDKSQQMPELEKASDDSSNRTALLSSGKVMHDKGQQMPESEKACEDSSKSIPSATEMVIKDKDQRIKTLERTLEDYSRRLASEMNKKVAADESSIENISIADRPMTISEEYSMVQSNEWLSAKESLDKNTKSVEVEKLTFLCDIMKIAEETASKLHKSVQTNTSRIMHYCSPGELYASNTQTDTSHSRRNSTKKSKGGSSKAPDQKSPTWELPKEFTNMLGDYLRKTCNEVDLKGMFQDVQTQLNSTNPKTWKKVKDDSALLNYLHKVCRLMWKMSIQRPPMELDFTAERKGEAKQEAHWGSSISPKAKVCVVYPILTHGTQVMGKGKIYLHD